MTTRTFQLDRREVGTPAGPVVLWGRFDRHQSGKPLGLVIRGAFAEPDVYDGLPSSFPKYDLVLAHLPGMHTPFLAESSIPAFAEAFDHAMAAFDRRPHVMGFSTGGLVGLGMRTAASVLAVDPPLQTGPLWPLHAHFRRIAREGDPTEIRDWLWTLFGVAPDSIVNRDYRYLVDEVAAPAIILVAGEPLEPERTAATMPGLITAEDRAWLSRHPRVRVLKAPGVGHNIPGHVQASQAMVDLYCQMIEGYPQGPAGSA